MNDTTDTRTRITVNATVLAAIYADLSSIGDYLADDAVLHPAEPGSPTVVGRDSIIAHEKALIRATEGMLVMQVQNIATNAHFGTVLGTLIAAQTDANGKRKKMVTMPFCGLWRFRDGLIVEHWEHDYDPDVLSALFRKDR